MATETSAETRVPMTWEEYEALGESARGEYFGGHLVVAAFPSHRHQDIVFRLMKLVELTLPDGARIVGSWGWSPDGVREELGPDVMVHTSPEETRLTSSTPLLVVEVLSSNRTTDLVEKAPRYARWGAATYWVVDPRDHELVVFEPVGGEFRTTAVHTTGVVTVSYAGIAVEIDLDQLLG